MILVARCLTHLIMTSVRCVQGSSTVIPRFGEFYCCWFFALLSQLACNILATWEDSFGNPQYNLRTSEMRHLRDKSNAKKKPSQEIGRGQGRPENRDICQFRCIYQWEILEVLAEPKFSITPTRNWTGDVSTCTASERDYIQSGRGYEHLNRHSKHDYDFILMSESLRMSKGAR